jgi:hypothetical protein
MIKKKTLKTQTMLDIETRWGAPMERLLPRLYEEHGSLEAVAQVLGITRTSVDNYILRLGLSHERKIVKT